MNDCIIIIIINRVYYHPTSYYTQRIQTLSEQFVNKRPTNLTSKLVGV